MISHLAYIRVLDNNCISLKEPPNYDLPTYPALIPQELSHSKPGVRTQVCYHSCQ